MFFREEKEKIMASVRRAHVFHHLFRAIGIMYENQLNETDKERISFRKSQAIVETFKELFYHQLEPTRKEFEKYVCTSGWGNRTWFTDKRTEQMRAYSIELLGLNKSWK